MKKALQAGGYSNKGYIRGCTVALRWWGNPEGEVGLKLMACVMTMGLEGLMGRGPSMGAALALLFSTHQTKCWLLLQPRLHSFEMIKG